MGVTAKLSGAPASMIERDDGVNRQAEATSGQQACIDDLVGRLIRVEARLELLTDAALEKSDEGGLNPWEAQGDRHCVAPTASLELASLLRRFVGCD